MDIDQLKLVLETVKNVSGDAQTVAIWWLLLDKLLPVVAWLIAGSGVYALMRIKIKVSSYEKELIEIREALGVKGIHEYYILSQDIKKMHEKIRDLKSK